jgi:tetratricopeptide (TPR) repeat protein
MMQTRDSAHLMNLPKLLKQAEKLVSYGKIAEAIEVYQEILSEDFQNNQIHSQIADLYIEKKDMQRASRHLFKVASDWAAQGNTAEATASYRRIIKILPKNTLAREKLLEIFTKNGAKAEAINLITELSLVAESEGNAAKTIEYLERLVSLDPGNRSHPTRLALFLNERGLKDKAAEIFYQVARDSFREERYEETLTTLERIRAINPKDRNLPIRVSEVFEKQGKIEKAIETVLASLAEEPSQPDAMVFLARLCVKAGKIEEAERIYEKLVKLNKSYLAQTIPFVEVLVAERKLDRALVHIERLHKEAPEASVRQKCVDLLEEILKLDPQKLDAYRLLELLYGEAFQYEQLAVTLRSHADAYIAKCEYAKAHDLTRQLVDLEPYNEEYRRKHQVIEKLLSGGGRAQTAGKAASAAAPEQDDEEALYADAKADSHFDTTLSIVTDEDVESFITDIELLEKFGQHASAIGRLEHVLKRYPNEIRLRQKLKSIYFDRKMPKRAAQECLEIAKILQQQNQKEEASKYLREAQRLNPVLSSARRETAPAATTQAPGPATTSDKVAALKGDLSEIGLLDVIQILDNCQKTGKVLVSSEGQAGTIFFNAGRIVNAIYQEKAGEHAVYSLVAVKGGTFEYQPSAAAFDIVIHNSNTNLLLEGLRLLDEANRDLNEAELIKDNEPAPIAPASQTPIKSPAQPAAAVMSPKAAVPVSQAIDDQNPLEEI